MEASVLCFLEPGYDTFRASSCCHQGPPELCRRLQPPPSTVVAQGEQKLSHLIIAMP
jgi:hypothetical protein